MDLIKTKTLGQILSHLHHATRPLLYADEHTSVSEALHLLHSRNISALPIITRSGSVTSVSGLVDVHDIVGSLIAKLSHGKSLTSCKEWDAVLEDHESLDKVLRFQSELVMNLVDKTQFDRVAAFSWSTPLRQVIEDMVGMRLHRIVVVVDVELSKASSSPSTVADNTMVLNISDLINFLAENVATWRTGVGQVKVSEILASHTKSGEVPIVIRESEPAVKGFQLMNANCVSGLAVVDDDGALLANFSSSDVKGLMSISSPSAFLEHLSLPIHLLLLKETRANVLRAPLTVTEDASLEFVVKTMALFRSCRVWVLDAKRHPVGVITPFEILRFFF